MIVVRIQIFSSLCFPILKMKKCLQSAVWMRVLKKAKLSFAVGESGTGIGDLFFIKPVVLINQILFGSAVEAVLSVDVFGTSLVVWMFYLIRFIGKILISRTGR